MKTIFFIFLFPMFLNAQGFDSGDEAYDKLGWEVRSEMGRQKIKDLREGMLVVRLKTGGNKIKAYERVVNSPSVSPEKRKLFEKRMAEAKKEIRSENNDLITAFDEDYSFSDVLFVADTAVHFLKEKKQSGYFLNKNMEVDPSLSLNEKPFLIAYYGASSLATSNGVEGIVIMGADFQELVDPFPHFTGLTTTRKAIGKWFNKKENIYYCKLMVQRLNEKMEEFYDKNN